MKLLALATSTSLKAYTTISSAVATNDAINALANTAKKTTTKTKGNNKSTGSGMFGGITNFFKNMNGGLKALGLAIAVVCAIVLGICLMGGGGNAIQKHKGWAIGIAAGIMVVCLAPTLVPAIASAVGG